MTPAFRILPYRAIALEVAERLVASRGSDPLAPWAEEVVVPSAGMSQAIAREVLARVPSGVAGLHLQSVETLARRIVNAAGEFPRIATEPERRLAMRMAARSIDHPIMESRGMPAMLERSYRDVRDSGVTLADLAPRLRGERKKTILRVWTEYERRIAGLGAVDPADLLLRATELAGAWTRPQLIAGFYDMTFAQRRLVEALRVGGWWVPTGMTLPGGLLQEVPSRPGAEAARGTVRALETHDAELRAVCASVATLLADGVPASEIGIVARSLEPYDAALLERFAAEHGFRTTLAAGVPLAAHRVGRGAMTLLRLRERGFPRADAIELVRDGLRTRRRYDADALDLATRRARVAGGTSAELSRVGNIDPYLALVRELEELTASLDLGQLSSLFELQTELDLAAADALDEIAELFRRAGAFDPPSVLDAIENVTLAEGRGEQGVWTSDVLRFRGRSFRHLFVVRMQDDVFPQRRVEDPLLPDADRRALGVREIGDGADEERLLFQLLLDSSENVTFSYAASDGFGKVLRPSRFVRGLGAATAAPDRTETAAAGVRRSTRPLQLLVQAGTRSVFDGFLTSVRDHIAARLHAVSPTQLEDYGECPQKFLLKHILGVEDLDHPERELQIQPRDKGKLDHQILERFYKTGMPLDALVDEAFDRHDEEVPPFNPTIRALERRATKRLLAEFVEWDRAELAAEGLEPRFYEYKFGTKREQPDHPEPFLVRAANVPLRIEGMIDRIDSDGVRFRIVDYKSGKALRHAGLAEKIDRGVRLQLALYAMAVSEFFGADETRVSGTIKPLVVAGAKPEKFAFALADKRGALMETLDLFVSAILEGTFPAFPVDGDFDSCKYCPVNHSCRTRHDSDERHAARRHQDPRSLLQGLGR